MIGVALLGFAIFFLWRRRQKADSEEQQLRGAFSESKEKENPYYEEAKERSQLAELGTLTPQLDSSARVEMPTHHEIPVAEMESREQLPPQPPTG